MAHADRLTVRGYLSSEIGQGEQGVLPRDSLLALGDLPRVEAYKQGESQTAEHQHSIEVPKHMHDELERTVRGRDRAGLRLERRHMHDDLERALRLRVGLQPWHLHDYLERAVLDDRQRVFTLRGEKRTRPAAASER